MVKEFRLGERNIGTGTPVYFVAEMSANHKKNYDTAVKIIKEAANAGADAIKLQTFKPDNMTLDSDRDYFRIKEGTLWDGASLYDLYQEAQTPWEWHKDLFQIAHEHHLDCFSTAFSPEAIDFLEDLDVPVHKTASFELVDLPLIKAIAGTGKPLIMSTGMGNLGEIEEAVKTAKKAGCDDLLLLKCTSAYPAEPDEMNLRTIPHMSETFDVPVGLSDHTRSTTVPSTAVAMGASMIEKHFTLSRELQTLDSKFSLEPDEFEKMVNSVRITEQSLGEISYEITDQEENNKIFRRSIFSCEMIPSGDPITKKNTKIIRPGYGLAPKYFDEIQGKLAAVQIKEATPISWNLLVNN